MPAHLSNGASPVNNSSKAKVPSKKSAKSPNPSQMKLSNFFRPPAKAKRKSPPSPDITLQSDRRSSPVSSNIEPLVGVNIPELAPDPEEEALLVQAVAEADQERSEKRAVQKAKAAPVWNELFAKKLPPLCTIHQKPCKDFSKSISQ